MRSPARVVVIRTTRGGTDYDEIISAFMRAAQNCPPQKIGLAKVDLRPPSFSISGTNLELLESRCTSTMSLIVDFSDVRTAFDFQRAIVGAIPALERLGRIQFSLVPENATMEELIQKGHVVELNPNTLTPLQPPAPLPGHG